MGSIRGTNRIPTNRIKIILEMDKVDILLYYFYSFRCYTTDSLDDLYSQKLTEIVCKGRVVKIEMVHFDVNSVVSIKF